MAQWVVLVAGVYVIVGLVAALFFVTVGAGRVDPAAQGATWGFRVAIFPGCVALWPFVLQRWRQGSPPPAERNAHRDAARRDTRHAQENTAS